MHKEVVGSLWQEMYREERWEDRRIVGGKSPQPRKVISGRSV